jgi:hypothetical protein
MWPAIARSSVITMMCAPSAFRRTTFSSFCGVMPTAYSMSVMPWPKKYSDSARVETVMPPGWPAVAKRATSMHLAVFMCGRSGTDRRDSAAAMLWMFRLRMVRSSTRQGVGRSASFMQVASSWRCRR